MDMPSQRYAVLFKVYYWDDYIQRQLHRLCLRAGPGRVFVVVDETKFPVADIRHEHVIRMTEEMSEAEGYRRHPFGNMFWYNTDYQMYHFLDQYPEYDYVFVCEYDGVVNIEIEPIIEAMARDGLGFVGDVISTPPRRWTWAAGARPYYPEGMAFVGRLVCCGAFSRDFARQLQAARRSQTRRAASGEIAATATGAIPWPIHEAFIGAEIARLGVVEAPLSDFGDTSRYQWAPPIPEFALPALSHHAILHPVIETHRYLQQIHKLHWKPPDLFDAGSGLWQAMEQYDAADVVPMFIRHFVRSKDLDSLERLRDYADRRCGDDARRLFNVALGKQATQSSTSEWSRRPDPAQDAAGAVNGRITGSYGFHTNAEEEPWWCVDLEAVYPVREIRIYNRMDQVGRGRSLVVTCSNDLVRWRTLLEHDGEANFGGADGKPLHIVFPDPAELRFLRLHLPKRAVLHLEEVEIYV